MFTSLVVYSIFLLLFGIFIYNLLLALFSFRYFIISIIYLFIYIIFAKNNQFYLTNSTESVRSKKNLPISGSWSLVWEEPLGLRLCSNEPSWARFSTFYIAASLTSSMKPSNVLLASPCFTLLLHLSSIHLHNCICRLQLVFPQTCKPY